MSADKPEVLLPTVLPPVFLYRPLCENDCCRGWQVSVDRETYEAYQRCSDIRIVDVTSKDDPPASTE